jgi:transmembrane 9 superfamily member 2/4
MVPESKVSLLSTVVVCFLLLALAAAKAVDAYYIPGVLPHSFYRGEEVPLQVNSLTSTHTQIPRDYYRLPFCRPDDGPKMASQNLGQFLTGNKIQNSPYVINMLKEQYCEKLCQITLSKEDASQLRLHIKFGYHNNWIIDNLPSAAIGFLDPKKRYAGGFPIGFIDIDRKTHLYNHVNIHIDYHQIGDKYRVVAFAVEPLSVEHHFAADYVWDGIVMEGMKKQLRTCPNHNTRLQRQDIFNSQVVKEGETILFTYGVFWQRSDVEWTSRWDVYLSEDHLVPAQVHWYSITNSIVVVLFLSLWLILILVRNLRRDVAAYHALLTVADEENDVALVETGWKSLHADVFRPPQSYPMLYCVFLGSGAQLGLTVLLVILYTAIGFSSPARRGSLMNTFLTFYVLMGSVAGYTSSRIYQAFRGRRRQLCTMMTALFFPGILFGTFLFFNVNLWLLHSSASAPFWVVIVVAAIWCYVAIPLVLLGAFFGYKSESIAFPTETGLIARAIPTARVVHNPMIGIVLAGFLPFAAAYLELFFIMTSLWMNQYYYVFGFTLIVYLILVVTCAEVTVLLVYYQLCAENHRWWWLAFFSSGSTAFYTLIHSIYLFRTFGTSRLLMTYLLYFGYMFLINFAMLLLFGTIGALTSLWFVCKIFSIDKVN